MNNISTTAHPTTLLPQVGNIPCAPCQNTVLSNELLHIISSPYYKIFDYNEQLMKTITIKPALPCSTPNCHGAMLYDYIDQDYLCLLCARPLNPVVPISTEPVRVTRYMHEEGHHIRKGGRPTGSKDGPSVIRRAPHNKRKVVAA